MLGWLLLKYSTRSDQPVSHYLVVVIWANHGLITIKLRLGCCGTDSGFSSICSLSNSTSNTMSFSHWAECHTILLNCLKQGGHVIPDLCISVEVFLPFSAILHPIYNWFSLLHTTGW